MSYSDHQDYHPIIDELVFYVTQWYEQASEKKATNEEAQILLTFGLAFEVEDTKYWRIVKQLGEDSLKEVRSDTLALLDTISYMKEAGILSNKAMREVSDLVNHLDTLNADQLVEFTLMYSSSEMQSAIDISESISKLESALLAKQDKFSPENFATICSVVAFDDADGQAEGLTLKLPIFLHANLDRVMQWLTDESLVGDM